MRNEAPADLPAIAGGPKAKPTPFGKERRYGEEELQELREALEQDTLFYAQGKKVYALEEEFARDNGRRFGVACSSGTAAVHAAFTALGLSPGDEVIVSPITDMGSIVPILYQGAVPVFADLTPHGYTLDPASVAERVTERTRAVLAVHLWGNTCNLDALLAICAPQDIDLVEDCAQAFGAEYRGRPVGTFGVAGCFSFNEFKHIACGDGGLVLTDDAELATRLRLATDKCYNRSPEALDRSPTFLANNYRMTELQAAVARAQLRKLPGIVSRRRAWCEGLSQQLREAPGISLPQATPGAEPSWWFYMLRVQPELLGVDADTFAEALRAEGIPATAHYIGQAIYRYPIFTRHSAYERGRHPYSTRDYTRESCPVAEAILETCVMLPVNQAYTDTDLEEVAAGVRKVAEWYACGRKEAER